MKDARRLDQWLSNLGYCSRREARGWLEAGRVTDPKGTGYSDPGQRLPANAIRVDGESLDHPDGLLVLMNKPLGLVCSHDRGEGPRVYDLLPDRWLRRSPAVTTVGRLDRDTSGLLLLTDRTELVHRLTSPRQKIAKVYEATLIQPVPLPKQTGLTALFAAGTLRLEDEVCAPAVLSWRSPTQASLSLTEGRYHQVRRMFAAVNLSVAELHRSAFGAAVIPQDLAPKSFVELPLDFAF